MTALLEFKHHVQHIFGLYEFYIMPLIRAAVAFVFFWWINDSMGYMPQLDNLLLIGVLALICGILPPAATLFTGFTMMVIHCYALGIEAAGFMLVLLLLLAIFFLRFSAGTGLVLALTPLSFTVGFPVMLPIGAGLLSSGAAAVPAGCGVVLYYFVRFLQGQSATLANTDVELVDKLHIMADGIVRNWGMWITVVAFILVILLVNLIRTRSFDFAWRVAIVAGGVTYVVVMMVGSYYLSATVDMTYLMVSTLLAVVVGLVLEFFFFGGDYSRTERLEYEDDEYYYYVKAVPKATVSAPHRRVKKISGGPDIDQEPEMTGSTYANPIFSPDEDETDLDLERKLEESLRDL
ncbi:MAG: hypothetical protein IKE03_01205 [Blautia sp.]|nr:hypothetical protein [Blautia sp.]